MVFLEVQVQNVSQDSLFFEQLRFDPSPDVELQDLTTKPSEAVRSGDILQCLFLLSTIPQKRHEMHRKARSAGGVVGLGKLDIRWTSRIGDSGRLATSQLVRRIPLPVQMPSSLMPSRSSPLQQERPPSALSVTTPQHQQTPMRSAMAGVPDLRSPSPMYSPRLGPGTVSPSPRHSAQYDEAQRSPATNTLTACLYVVPPDQDVLQVFKPFKVDFQLNLTSTCPTKRRRHLSLAVQHVDHHLRTHRANPEDGANDAATLSSAPRPQHLSTPRQSHEMPRPPLPLRLLPPPCPLSPSDPFFIATPTSQANEAIVPSADVRVDGNSILHLEEVVFHHGEPLHSSSSSSSSNNNNNDNAQEPLPEPAPAPEPEPADEAAASSRSPDIRVSMDSTATDDMSLSQVLAKKQASRLHQTATVHFSLTYVPFAPGILAVGGVRVLMLRDVSMRGEDEEAEAEEGMRPCSLLEHDVILEVLIN